MTSTLDVFREQREAVEQVHARLMEVGALLGPIREQVELLAGHQELCAVLQPSHNRMSPSLRGLRSRAGFANTVAERIMTMTPAERRPFDALMKWRAPSR